MRFVTWPEYAQLPRPNLSWVIHNLIPRPGLVALFGPPKAGKSFLAANVARKVAAGEDFLGHKTEAGRVLYIQVDAGEMSWRDRIQKQMESGIKFPDNLILVHPEDSKRPLDLLQEETRAYLRAVVAGSDPMLVVLDVLRDFHRADENDSTEMKIVGDMLETTFKDQAVFLLHHTRKIPADVTDPDPASYGRGSNYISGKMDAFWLLHGGWLKIVSRFDETTRYRAIQGENGDWDFPEVEQRMELRDKLLSLCVEHPELTHAKLAPLAKARWGVSRPTYYRHLAGQRCAHRQAAALGAPASVSPAD